MVGQRPHPYILRPRPWPSGHAPAGENRRLFPSVLAPGTLRGADRRKPGKAPHSGPLRLTIDLAPPHKKAIPLWQGGAPAWALAAFAGPRVASGTPPEPSPSVCTAGRTVVFLTHKYLSQYTAPTSNKIAISNGEGYTRDSCASEGSCPSSHFLSFGKPAYQSMTSS